MFNNVENPLILSIQSEATTSLGGRLYRRAVIRTGKFYDAKQDRNFEVNDDVLKHWADTTTLMLSRGVPIPLPLTHTDAPDKNRGWVRAMNVEGDKLMATLEAIGEDGAKAIERNSVSIYSPPKWVDGEKNEYEWPILHVALTSRPVITGLGDAKPIAASHVLAQEKIPMEFAKIGAALGITEAMTEENAEGLILSALTKVSETHQTELVAKDSKIRALELSHESKPVDPTLLSLAMDNRSLKLSQLLEAGKITKNVCDTLTQKFASSDVLTLSLSRDGGKTDGFAEVLECLQKNDPVISFKEKTPGQVLQLSEMEKTEANPLTADADARVANSKK